MFARKAKFSFDWPYGGDQPCLRTIDHSERMAGSRTSTMSSGPTNLRTPTLSACWSISSALFSRSGSLSGSRLHFSGASTFRRIV